jgi:hypothetical protein
MDLANLRNLVLQLHTPRISLFKFKILCCHRREPVMLCPIIMRSVVHNRHAFCPAVLMRLRVDERQLISTDILVRHRPFGNLCFCVESEVMSESGTILLLGFSGCVESTVGNDSREDLGRRSHFRDVGRYTCYCEAAWRVGSMALVGRHNPWDI